MNITVRHALHNLAPEPPDALGLHMNVRRRVGRIRRRRAILAGAVVAAFVFLARSRR